MPTLIMGGTQDGIIARSSFRYGLEKWETPATPIVRTFQEGLSSSRNDSYLVIFNGANHLSIGDCLDSTSGNNFLDFPTTYPQEQYRVLMADIIGNFIDACVRHNKEALKKLDRLLDLNNPAIAQFEIR